VTRPWLSVILPTYNGGAMLTEALAGVAQEADPGIEVIAIDDGSTDDTPAVLAGFSRRLPMTVMHRRVGNWAANTNHGLELARGEWVSILHQDDYWLPGRAVAVRRQLAATPGVSLLFHPCRFVTPAGAVVGVWRCPLPAGRPLPPAFVLERHLVQNFVAVPGAVFRASAARACGGLDPALWFTADWDLWLKLEAGGPTVYLNRPYAAFRLHPESQTAARSGKLDDFRRQLEVIGERHAGAWPARDPGVRAAVARVTRAAVEVNVALAAAYHGRPVKWRQVFAALAALGVSDWHRMLRDARLAERVAARLRAGFARRG
jgi:glycosyltransferase involved in cell wall biosynthesis